MYGAGLDLREPQLQVESALSDGHEEISAPRPHYRPQNGEQPREAMLPALCRP